MPENIFASTAFRKTVQNIIIGIAVLLVFCIVALLLWAGIALIFRLDVSEAKAIPTLIYLAGILLATAVMTVQARGGAVFAAMVVSLIAAVVMLILAPEGTVTFASVLIKLFVSLLTAIAGFTLTKLYLMFGWPMFIRRWFGAIDEDVESGAA